MLESAGLLIYDAVYNFNKMFYGYENWQTLIFLAVSIALTAAVIVFAVMTNKKKNSQNKVKAFAITLIAVDMAMLLQLTYGVANNVMSDLTVYHFGDVAALISYIAQTILLTVVSGDLLGIIGAGMLLSFGFKNAKK